MKIINYEYGMTIPTLITRHFQGMVKSLTVKKMINVSTFMYERVRKPLISKVKPFYLKIEPTNYCDHRCPNCATLKKRPKGYMELSLFKEIVEYFKSSCMRLCLYGQGESLLHKDIFTMIAFAEKNRCPVSISSNYNNMDENKTRQLLNANLDYLIICIDGLTQKTHSRYRINGNLQQVFNNLEMLANLKSSGNYKNPTIEVQTIAFSYIKDEIPLLSKKLAALGAEIHCIRKNMYEEQKKKLSRKNCPYLWGTMFITWDGKMYPCEVFCNKEKNFYMHFDEVKKGKNYWNNNKMVESRFILKNPWQNVIPTGIPCEKCFHFPSSQG